MPRSTKSNNASNDVALVLACVCGAVEKLEEVRTLDGGKSQQQYQQQHTLEEIYRQTLWQQPLEATLDEMERWSLSKRTRVKKGSPQQQKQHAQTAVDDWQRLIESTPREPLRQQLQTQLQRLIQAQADAKLAVPALLKVDSVEEDELETRWDAHGRAQPLHRNILGERFATLANPLSYRKQRSATEIFQQMRPRMKEELKTREARRIQRLNQQAKRQRASKNTQALSPEEELEARLDQSLSLSKGGEEQEEVDGNNSGL